MAQHIGIEKIDEHGKTLEELQINFADVVNILEEIDDYKNKYPWISTIDPYEDTVFNILQAPLVIRDLQELKEEKQELKEIIDELVNFLEKLDNHEYIKFIGD